MMQRESVDEVCDDALCLFRMNTCNVRRCVNVSRSDIGSKIGTDESLNKTHESKLQICEGCKGAFRADDCAYKWRCVEDD